MDTNKVAGAMALAAIVGLVVLRKVFASVRIG